MILVRDGISGYTDQHLNRKANFSTTRNDESVDFLHSDVWAHFYFAFNKTKYFWLQLTFLSKFREILTQRPTNTEFYFLGSWQSKKLTKNISCIHSWPSQLGKNLDIIMFPVVRYNSQINQLRANICAGLLISKEETLCLNYLLSFITIMISLPW